MIRRMALGMVVMLALSASVAAQDLRKGAAAHNRGDYDAALKEWRPLAALGNAQALFNIGVMHEKGQGVPRDSAEAVNWYRKAADQGYPKAQSDLGFMYANGRGVRRDPIRAYMWFSLAATKGNASAVWGRDQMVRRMTAAEVGKAQRLAREWWEKRQRR